MQINICFNGCIAISKIIKIIFKENTFKNYSACSPIEVELSVNSFICGNSPRSFIPK